MRQLDLIRRLIELNSFSEPEIQEHRAELPDNKLTANPNLKKRTPRYFPPEYNMRILAQADACRHGELGKLLRREKLFSSQLTAWRKERDAGGTLDKPGPGPLLPALRSKCVKLNFYKSSI